MSERNVELYRRAIAAWNEGDLEAWRGLGGVDWEFRTTGTFPGFEPVYRGREGMTEFWENLREAWEFFHIELESVRDAGDRVVGLVRFHGRGKASGAEVFLEYAHVATYVDGRNTLLEGYLSHAEAIEAARLSQPS
jgi:ketosteroid isomerase-like protein